MVWAHAQVAYGKNNWFPQGVTGTAPRYLAIRDWEDLEEGDCFTEDDVPQKRRGLPDRRHGAARAVR